jgi:hypothetical protein
VDSTRHSGAHCPRSHEGRIYIRREAKNFLVRIGQSSDENAVNFFLDKRPNGVAFQNSTNEICFLEFTRAMDTWEGWEEKKDKAKNDRYNSRLVFINEVTIRSAKWTVS